MPDDTRRLAVLIDADNSSVSVLSDILAEVSKLGTATVKRVYGDFTSSSLKNWAKVLAEHAVQPIQQYRNTVKKNATDSALIIDAMDLLHTERFEGFCLVSSDSDFTRLAIRIREDGLWVFGFGQQKTPESFVKACNRFFYTEILSSKPTGAGPQKLQVTEGSTAKGASKNKSSAATTVQPTPLKKVTDTEFQDALDKALDAATQTDSGRADLGTVGLHLQKLMPEFDPRNYGVKRLSDLMEKVENLEISREGTDGGPQRVYVGRK